MMYYIILQLKHNGRRGCNELPRGCVWTTQITAALSRACRITESKLAAELENDETTVLKRVATWARVRTLMERWYKAEDKLALPSGRKGNDMRVAAARRFFRSR
jgi:hypothetical protein